MVRPTHSVLVTGGAGYIGSHVVASLLQAGSSVVSLDRVAHAGTADGTCTAITADITDPAALDDVFAGFEIDAVIHLAALKSAPDSVRDPGSYFRTNVLGSLAVVDSMLRAGVRQLIFSSSCAVYGTPTELPITETSPCRPDNPYGESKLLTERTLPWFGHSHQLRWLSLRYFNAAGADEAGRMGERLDAPALVPSIVRAAKLGDSHPLEVFGDDYPTPDGTAVRDYVHVMDVAAAHVAAVEYLAEGKPSRVLNVGTGRGTSVRQMIDAVQATAGGKIPFVVRPRRPGDPAAVWADTSAAETALGWKATRDVHDIARTAWRSAQHDRQLPG